MELSNVKTASTFSFWFKPLFSDTNKEISEDRYGTLAFSEQKGEFVFRNPSTRLSLAIREKKNLHDLEFYLRRGTAHAAEITAIAPDKSLEIRLLFFSGALLEMGTASICLEEDTIRKCKEKIWKNKPTEAKFFEELSNKFNFSIDGEKYFIMTGPRSAEKSGNTQGNNDGSGGKTSPPGSFQLIGDSIMIKVEKKNEPQLLDYFTASSPQFGKRQNEDNLFLARGELRFSSKKETVSAYAAETLRKIMEAPSSYLKTWDVYGEIEEGLLLQKARDVGTIKYTKTEIKDEGCYFFVDKVPDQLALIDSLELIEEEPEYLRNSLMTWKDISEQMQAKKQSGTSFYQTEKIEDRRILLKGFNTSPPAEGFLILSLRGDSTRLKRRVAAREKIISGTSAIPFLGLLIEEKGEVPTPKRTPKVEPITPHVLDKIFRNPPTEMQREAIEAALNTPDIALIQGPPGTGKTTVITAILERLNEEHDKSTSISGKILVSGFQHDAVENIVSRLSINSLPSIKFGEKSGSAGESGENLRKRIEDWCEAITENIKKKYPEITKTKDPIALSGFLQTYYLSPSATNAANLLHRILELPRKHIPEEIVEKAADILNSLKSEQSATPQRIQKIRSLRIFEESFMDDGPERALELLSEFEEELAPSDEQLLQKASIWIAGRQLDFLDPLKELKIRLLKKYPPYKPFRLEKPRRDVLDVFQQTIAILKENRKLMDKRDICLAEFLQELESNPGGTRKAIEDYNLVFAATTQQAEGSEIKKAKSGNPSRPLNNVTFDTVIIDEAARANPRDLLIPMVQAEKRIILVGDHRQLPHIIDEKIMEVFLENNKENTSEEQTTAAGEIIKKGSLSSAHVLKALGISMNEISGMNTQNLQLSLFEVLFHRLKELEKKDGIKRTVTLDKQYRTHPLLGKFVSDNFYKEFNEGYDSPLPGENFAHSLESTNGKAAVWIDVPNAKPAAKVGLSWVRAAEAETIAKQLALWINSEEAKNLSFGVISFYRAQCDEVLKALEKYGISDGKAVSEDYKYFRAESNKGERLRIGTVDSFQGMEFDVVFLSVVRSADPKKLEKRADISLFGHLMSANRLCVSMSRQKKLLVVVGDSNFFRTERAKSAVPALFNYHQLCTEEGVVL